ncbi:MAG: putative aminohydrolase SsnA [Treponema sp.]|nr:putative aminohydrolase SsnA [Treponema sp.]
MIVIGNGRVVTRDPDNPFIENGAIAVDGRFIKRVGTLADVQKEFPAAQFVDAHGGVIMPGLINMHNHIYSAFARGMAISGYNPHGFMDILEGLWWRLDRTMNLQDTYWSGMATYLDCIKNGVTTIFDHHASFGAIEGSLSELSRGVSQAGIRACLCYEVSDRDGTEKSHLSVQENENFLKYCKDNPDPMQAGAVGMHASFTIGNNTMEQCAALAKKYDTGCHIHVAEGLSDVTDCLSKYGKRIVERLYDMNILGSKTLAVHCVHVNHQEMKILKETDTMVVHNPESNMGNAVGCGDVPGLFEEGLLLGLGTDGYTNDMFESYKVAAIIHKHHTANPNAGWVEIPTMLFKNNALMANRYFKEPLGVLKEGYAADIVVTDYNPLTPMTADNIGGHVQFGMSGRSVVTTMCAGKILMQDRKCTELDEEEILAKSREQAADLWKRIND